MAADRKLTFSDIEFESSIQKIGLLAKRCLVLAAGDDMTVHSQAIKSAHREIQAEATSDIERMAEIYAQHVSKIKTQRAAQLHLAPFGLSLDDFIHSQNSYSDAFTNATLEAISSFSLNVEAIIAGCDDEKASIFHMDKDGIVRCFNDVGFVAAGIGASHAQSHFMYSKYDRNSWYPHALFVTYFAKRRAEAAPGVGKETDLHWISRDGWAAVHPELMERLAELYDRHENERGEMAASGINELNELQKDLHARGQAARDAAGPTEPSTEGDSPGPSQPRELPGSDSASDKPQSASE